MVGFVHKPSGMNDHPVLPRPSDCVQGFIAMQTIKMEVNSRISLVIKGRLQHKYKFGLKVA